MAQIIKNKKDNFIEEIYSYPGLWDIPSKCGLMIVESENKTITIVTDLYEENPGTSITEYCSQLAQIIAEDKNIAPKKMQMILHNPDLGSKYEFMSETFDLVHFNIEDKKFLNPKWERISREDVEKMIGKK